MSGMSDFDHLDLDGHSLRLFLAVLEEGSVTAAATRLGLTQSAVSHGLAKLRRIVPAPLFTRSGRGIVATAQAQALADHARGLLDGLRAFASGSHFDPAQARLDVTIAANDFQRDLILPGFFRQLCATTTRPSLRVIPSGAPGPEMLREGRCDLLVTPIPPVAADIVQKRLFEDRYVCYFDPACRDAPRGAENYLAARHVTVVYTDNERLDFDKRLAARGWVRDIAVSVPSFAGVPPFLKGTTFLASMPSRLDTNLMRGFAQVSIPLEADGSRGLAALPMYMAWHQRFQADPAHIWLRDELERAVAG